MVKFGKPDLDTTITNLKNRFQLNLPNLGIRFGDLKTNLGIKLGEFQCKFRKVKKTNYDKYNNRI